MELLPHAQSRWEKIPVRISADPDLCAEQVAWEIADLVKQRKDSGARAVLGLATGSTPQGVYQHLIRMHREKGLSFRHVTTFNLDEYFPLGADHQRSYHRYMWDHLFSHIDIDRANVHIPCGDVPLTQVPEYCRRYEECIVKAGGLDFQLLGIGRTGHIGFNEPGSPLESRTRLVELDPVTRSDAAPDWRGAHHVPTHAITMGIRTILDSRRLILLATGPHKASIIRTALEGPETADIPASFLRRHRNVTAVLDGDAARELTRVQTPWLLGPLADFKREKTLARGCCP